MRYTLTKSKKESWQAQVQSTSIGEIPDQYFFPSEHCPMVPAGGFTLGGGYGIGFNTSTHRGHDDAAGIETTIVLGYSPQSVLEATGETKTVGLALTVWSEQDDNCARAVLKKYTRNKAGAIFPPDSVESVNPKTFSEAFQFLYPDKARYLCEGFVCDVRLFTMTDD